jgi:hypothetical protein
MASISQHKAFGANGVCDVVITPTVQTDYMNLGGGGGVMLRYAREAGKTAGGKCGKGWLSGFNKFT